MLDFDAIEAQEELNEQLYLGTVTEESIEELLKKGARLSKKNPDIFYQSMHYVLAGGHAHSLRMLAQYITFDKDDGMHLMYAVENGDKELVEAFIDLGFDPTAPTSNQARPTLMHCAAAYQHTDMCRFLASHGVPVDITAGGGQTSYEMAIRCKFSKYLARTLIELGAKNHPDDLDYEETNDTIERLLNHKNFDIDDVKRLLKEVPLDHNNTYQLLLESIYHHHQDITKLLLENSFIQPEILQLSLSACTTQQTAILDLLLAKGLNINSIRLDKIAKLLTNDDHSNRHFITHKNSDHQHVEFLHYLIEKGYDLAGKQIKENVYDHPIIEAARHHKAQSLIGLIEAGCDPMVADKEGHNFYEITHASDHSLGGATPRELYIIDYAQQEIDRFITGKLEKLKKPFDPQDYSTADKKPTMPLLLALMSDKLASVYEQHPPASIGEITRIEEALTQLPALYKEKFQPALARASSTLHELRTTYNRTNPRSCADSFLQRYTDRHHTPTERSSHG